MAWFRVPVRHGEQPADAIERLGLDPRVAAVAPEYEYHEATTPNDPWYPAQWNLHIIGIEEAWSHTTGMGVTAAILDSGVSTDGADLSCHSFVNPFNAFTSETGIGAVKDDTGHGTHTTGTVAECTDNSIGAAGIAPDAAIMPVKVLDGGSGSSLEVANGIHWAVEHGADVINLSLGRECAATWPTCSDLAVDEAIERAHDSGIPVIVATGNGGVPWVSNPANHPLSLAVGATTTIDTIAPYSNTGDAIDFVAPGGNWGELDGKPGSDAILQESFDTSGWGVLPRVGTSFAAAHVTGIIALMRSVNPGMTVDRIKSVLSSTSLDLGSAGWDATYGAGRVDAGAAVAASLPPPLTLEALALGGTAALSDAVLTEVADLIGATPTRLAGGDRYETAAAISETVHPTGSKVAFVVSGERFPDALSVGPVAALQDAPILLVTKTGVPHATAAELQRLAPSEVVLVGGTAVISDAVANQIIDLVPAEVARIAGPDRYATAAEVAQAAFPETADSVVLVTGEDFPDGLAAGPVATTLHAPILLSTAASLPAATRAELIRLSPNSVIIVGGISALSPQVEDQVRALGLTVDRIAGNDRYATAAALANAYFSSFDRPIFLATGEAFPDALSGAAAAGSVGGPVLLTRTDSLPASTASELGRFFP